MAMRQVFDAFCQVVRRGWPLLVILLAPCAPSPAAALDELHIVSRWSGNLAEHYFWNGGQWQGWSVIGGKTILSPPALVSYQGKVHVFAVADDQKLYHAVWNGSSWSGWFDFGGPFATNMGAAAVDYYGYLIVMAVTPDNRLLMTWFDPSTGKWADYALFAINIFGRPALTMHNGNLHFLVRGSDDNYHHRVWDTQNQSLSPWANVGGPFAAGGAIASFGGQLHIFGSSNNGELFQVVNLTQFINRGAPPGTQMVGSPAVANFADVALVVLVRGTNNGLYGRVLSGGAWSAYSGSFGQALTGPAMAFHRTTGGGGGGGPNRPPFLRELRASRTVMSFGKDPAFRTGVGGEPGFRRKNPPALVDLELEPVVAPRIISIDTKVEGDFTLAEWAAGNLPSCCTLLVAEGASDPDGDPIIFHWSADEGTFYSTGDDGSGGFPFGAVITDIAKYNRNSVFYEPRGDLPFPLVDEFQQGGQPTISVYVSDVRSSPNEVRTSETRRVDLEYDKEIHLEIEWIGGHRLPHDHHEYPGGIVMEYFLNLKGDFELRMPVVFRIDCGARRKVISRIVNGVRQPGSVIDQPLVESGGRIRCYYDKEELGSLVLVSAIASVGFVVDAGRPGGGAFAFPIEVLPGLDFFRSLGCTAPDTLSQVVKVEGCTKRSIDLFDNGPRLDDSFDLLVDGSNLGRTPAGGDKLFDVSYLKSGKHEVCVRAVKAPDNDGTFELRLHCGDGITDMEFVGGDKTTRAGSIAQGAVRCFEFIVP